MKQKSDVLFKINSSTTQNKLQNQHGLPWVPNLDVRNLPVHACVKQTLPGLAFGLYKFPGKLLQWMAAGTELIDMSLGDLKNARDGREGFREQSPWSSLEF